ncbi:ankyrin repeat-containing protein BDA1-like [Lycium barbarum]|uniref:ankyrin repeat-containing protein BDA1-like n=1 Tax=Lycium barbarum TaxID=112863 RepID=UPI00293ED0EB|nr:ankyrin repeat-containing protein BDA1-like [Lycium barbarum]
MDQRLFEAARTGGENPLHIACIVGQVHFAREMIKLRRKFAAELNQDGLSPLHIASANGNVDIVKEQLNLDHNLCGIKGREQRAPLHYAVIKGRVRVITELIAASPDCITDYSARNRQLFTSQ